MTEYDRQCALALYRRILDRTHEGGSIFYDEGRMKAYVLIAILASNLRKEAL